MKKLTLTILTLTLAACFSLNAADEKADVTVNITGNDTMMYDKTTFEVKSGQKVKLVFKNIGKLPKQAMGHNVKVDDRGVMFGGYQAIAIDPESGVYIGATEMRKDGTVTAY